MFVLEEGHASSYFFKFNLSYEPKHLKQILSIIDLTEPCTQSYCSAQNRPNTKSSNWEIIILYFPIDKQEQCGCKQNQQQHTRLFRTLLHLFKLYFVLTHAEKSLLWFLLCSIWQMTSSLSILFVNKKINQLITNWHLLGGLFSAFENIVSSQDSIKLLVSNKKKQLEKSSIA